MSKDKVKIENLQDASNKPPKRKAVVKTIVRIFVIAVLFLILIMSYTFIFSSGLSKGGAFGARVVGVIYEKDFYDAKNGDLIFIKHVSSAEEIQEGDVVIYHINGKVGSVKVTSVDASKKLITTMDKNNTKYLAFELILGKQGSKVAGLGYVWGFFASTTGVIVVSVILLAYVYYITFSRINKETTEKGKQLLASYKKAQRDTRVRKRLIDNFRKTDGFSPEDSVIIDGSMGDNLIELVSYTAQGSLKDVSETYKYILEKVHRAYMFKEKLSKNDKLRITNAIEMCGIVDSFSETIKFKLIDLILLEPIVEFDIGGFEKLCVKFLHKNINLIDLENFGSVLFVLITKNPRLINSSITKVIETYNNKVNQVDKQKNSNALSISNQLLLMLPKERAYKRKNKSIL